VNTAPGCLQVAAGPPRSTALGQGRVVLLGVPYQTAARASHGGFRAGRCQQRKLLLPDMVPPLPSFTLPAITTRPP
jgi:hypothetical protein